MVNRPAAGALVLVMLAAGGASAHGVLEAGENPWTAWNLTPGIALGALLAAGLYGVGFWRRRHRMDGVRVWRHAAFFAGLAVIFLALQSPIDPIAERQFVIHQIQHLLLRMIGPMLVMLSAPQAVLIAGMPDPVRRRILTPVVTNQMIRRLFSPLAHPVLVTALFIGALYFWQIPKYHAVALLNDDVHYIMHASLLFAGLLFFWRIFDYRPAPLATGFGVRLMMLWLMILSNIALGSYIAFKQRVLYPAYDVLGRLGDHSAITDERLGGMVIWIPSSMMGLVAILIVAHIWGRQETMEARRRSAMLARQGYGRNEPPMTAADLVALAAPKNRTMGLGFAVFSVCVFMAAIAAGIINQLIGT